MRQTPPRLRHLVLGATAVVLACPALAIATPSHSSHRGAETALRDLGALPEPTAKSERVYSGAIAQIDARARRMYYVYTDPNQTDHVVTYDLRPRIPRPVASGVLGPHAQMPVQFSPYVAALDTKRHHLVILGLNVQSGGQVVPTSTPTLHVYDTKTSKAMPDWIMPTRLPGFVPAGITYSRRDDRVYMVGDFSSSRLVNDLSADVVNPGAAVVAVDPGDGSVDWIKPIPQCQKVLNDPNAGGPLFHSTRQPALYFVCVTGSSVTSVTYAQSGLVRLTVDPDAHSASAAKDFPVDFFPISGQYFNGAEYAVAAFDHTTDRFFLQSMSSRTPGDWVFDGLRSAWVGFVPAPEDTDKFIGFNEGLGRLYVGIYRTADDPTNGLVVANGRQTPVPAGSLEPMSVSGPIATDDGSRRLFILPAGASETLAPYRVVQDVAPKAEDIKPLDFDSLTSKLPESRASYVNFSGDADGFGANLVFVGGLSGALHIGTPFDIPSVLDSGSRGLRLGQVSGLGVRSAGASGSAQAVVTDLNTDNDYQSNGKLGPWPYGTASCLDSGGGVKPQQTDYDGSTARVTCDLEHSRATGAANAAALSTAAIRVGHADSTGTVRRITKSGSVTDTQASSAGIRVDLPGGDVLRVGHVTASMTARAHGVAGTTAATYDRSIGGVTITDGKGKTVFGPQACATTIEARGGKHPKVHDTCAALAKAIRPYTQNRLWLSFPMPEAIATPLGAYAAVDQSDIDYRQERTVNDQGVVYPNDSTALRPAPALQVEVFNDASERSRLLAQFAAVQGDAVFATAGQGSGDDAPLGAQPTAGNHSSRQASGDPNSGRTGASGDDAVAPTPGTGAPVAPPAVAAAPTSGLAGWLFLHRSLRDALLLASVLALVAGAVLLAFRRQRLLTAMTITTERPSS